MYRDIPRIISIRPDFFFLVKYPQESRVNAAFREFNETVINVEDGKTDETEQAYALTLRTGILKGTICNSNINGWLRELRKILRRCIRPYVSTGKNYFCAFDKRKAHVHGYQTP